MYQPAKNEWILSGLLCFLSLLEINFLIYLSWAFFFLCFFFLLSKILPDILLFPSSSLSKHQYPSLLSPFLIIINIMDFTNPFSHVYKWVQVIAILFKFLKLYNNVIILSDRIPCHCKFFKFSTNMLKCGFHFTDQNGSHISNCTNNGFVITTCISYISPCMLVQSVTGIYVNSVSLTLKLWKSAFKTSFIWVWLTSCSNRKCATISVTRQALFVAFSNYISF